MKKYNKLALTALSLLMVTAFVPSLAMADSVYHYHRDSDQEWRYNDRHDESRYERRHQHYNNHQSYWQNNYSHYRRMIVYKPSYRYHDEVQPYFRIGDRFPSRVRYYEPERYVLRQLPAPRYGTRYIQVDKDVYLISEATKRILDAVVLISATR